MKYRQYGNTGTVSEIGFGAWQLGNQIDWSKMSKQESINLVHEAIEEGINFFDTAPNYGHGKSEALLGEALKGKREQVVLNTKFGHHASGEINFNETLLKASVDGSLKRLQRDYLDSILLHNPEMMILEGKTNHFQILEDLKQAGKILAYGASLDSSHEMLTLMKNTKSEVIETMFNIFHQETKNAFNSAKEKNIALIAKVPLDSGWLSGKYTNQDRFQDIRKRWSKDVLNRRFALLEEVKKIIHEDIPLPQIALQFILSYPEITTVIPGTKNTIQLKENINSTKITLTEEIRYKLIQLWEEKLKDNPLPW